MRSALPKLGPGETTTQEFSVGEEGATGGEPLLDAVNAQLDAIIADGTYESIFEKWFKRTPPEQFRPSG